VEALPLGLDEGGHSLSFGVTAAVHDPGLPILEMTTTGYYEDDAGVTSVVVGSPDAEAPRTLRCSPTVSRTVSTLALDRPAPTASSIDVFDVAGRLVRALPLASGERSVAWDGRSDVGARVATGVYFARWSDGVGSAGTTRVIRVR
jgi:hypothetical protein